MNEFEKKYKDALGWMRDVYPTLTGATKEDAEHFFPELKDSEDERTRKWIIEVINEVKFDEDWCASTERCDKAIAWLENQKENPDRLILIGKAKSEKQVVLLAESNGDENIYWDTKSEDDAVSLLEKGLKFFGKQKPSDWSEEDEKMRNEAIESVIYALCEQSGSYSDEEPVLRWLKSLNRNPIEWEDCREEDLQTRFAFYTYKDEPGALYLSNLFVEEASRNAGFGTRILHAAEKVAETIGASSIRLKVKQGSPANAWYRKHGYGYMTFEDGHDWLEKRLEYLKPGNQADWSETDDRMIGGIRSILEQHALANNAVDVNGELCEGEYIEMDLWLQSLSSRLKLDDRFMEGYHKGQADAEASYNKRVSYHVGCPRYTETRNTK